MSSRRAFHWTLIAARRKISSAVGWNHLDCVRSHSFRPHRIDLNLGFMVLFHNSKIKYRSNRCCAALSNWVHWDRSWSWILVVSSHLKQTFINYQSIRASYIILLSILLYNVIYLIRCYLTLYLLHYMSKITNMDGNFVKLSVKSGYIFLESR